MADRIFRTEAIHWLDRPETYQQNSALAEQPAMLVLGLVAARILAQRALAVNPLLLLRED